MRININININITHIIIFTNSILMGSLNQKSIIAYCITYISWKKFHAHVDYLLSQTRHVRAGNNAAFIIPL